MKALVLAAGFGTRLKPYTRHTPKALFTIGNRPLLDKIIADLREAGADGILVNTHHLHGQIEQFVGARHDPIPVRTRFEAEILGTGGAIKNAADFFDDRPFIVLNSDIITDIDLAAAYRFHMGHPHPATLVLVDRREFNTVHADSDGSVLAFGGPPPGAASPPVNPLTFTGIQILDRACLDFMPTGVFSTSIDAYRKMIGAGCRIQAYVPDAGTWEDVGTPDRYKAAAIRGMTAEAFTRAFPDDSAGQIRQTRLKGDGSDRRWYRVRSGRRSLVLVDHGIRQNGSTSEVDSFVDIGNHLFRNGAPVPKIFHSDRFSGVAVLEDLGDGHLQDFVRTAPGAESVAAVYRRIIRALIRMSDAAGAAFDPAWAWQTARFDQSAILETECRYFVDAFLRGYLNRPIQFEDLIEEFTVIAERATTGARYGFMHRDFQSRNIMVKGQRFYFIDFQGGRIGPLQYDLASLLIDPYVDIPDELQTRLVDHCIRSLQSNGRVDRDRFLSAYRYCALARNLQILGAFSHLSRIKGKAGFEPFIPGAVKSLKHLLTGINTPKLGLLSGIAADL